MKPGRWLAVALFGLAAVLPAMAAAPPADGVTVRMTADGLERHYILVVPKRRLGPLPLIVVLHGTVGTGRKMQLGLEFDQYVERYGFAVAYPDAYIEPGKTRTTRWNDGRGTLASTRLKVDDVSFLRAMVRDVGQHVALDAARIFVTGPSNGGMMTYRAACEAADLFAAAAPVIGSIAAPIADACRSGPPMSLLAINGTEDPFVPFEGGTVCRGIGRFFCEGGEVISAPASLDVFAARARCASTPQHTMLASKFGADPKVEQLRFEGCAGGRRVAALWIHGGGHNWPPKPGQLGARNGRPTRNLDATLAIVEFFLGR